MAVDLTNVRPDQKKRIGLFGGKEVEIFSPTYALRFMAALERICGNVPIIYLFDAPQRRNRGKPELDQLSSVTNQQHQADSDEFLSYFERPAELDRGIWQMAEEPIRDRQGRYKADYGLARLHNDFNVILISRDQFANEINNLNWFESPERLMHFGFHRSEQAGQSHFHFFNFPGRPGGAIIQELLDDDRHRIEQAREQANLLMLELVSPTGMVTRARPPRIPLRPSRTKDMTAPKPVTSPRPQPVAPRHLPLLTLFSMQHWAPHKGHYVAVIGRLFVEASEQGLVILRWIGPRFDVRLSGEAVHNISQISNGTFVRVEGLLDVTENGSWQLTQVTQIVVIAIDEALPQLVIQPKPRQSRFVSWEKALWKLRSRRVAGSGPTILAPPKPTGNAENPAGAEENDAPEDPISVKSVQLHEHQRNLKPHQRLLLEFTIYPTNADDRRVMWSSSNPSVARVDGNGNVVTNQPGTAVITIRTYDGDHSDRMTLDVVADRIPDSPPLPQLNEPVTDTSTKAPDRESSVPPAKIEQPLAALLESNDSGGQYLTSPPQSTFLRTTKKIKIRLLAIAVVVGAVVAALATLFG